MNEETTLKLFFLKRILNLILRKYNLGSLATFLPGEYLQENKDTFFNYP